MKRSLAVLIGIIWLSTAQNAQAVCTGLIFSDVNESLIGADFCSYIEQLKLLGITQGCSADDPGTPNVSEAMFCPFLPATRAQMAAFIMRAISPPAANMVLAKNILIEKTGNSLISNDLQNALDNELAIKLSEVLPGTTWTITNKTTDSWYKGTTGQVTFYDGTLTIDQGRFAAGGLYAPNDNPEPGGCQADPQTPISYEIIDNSIMYVAWYIVCADGSGFDWSSTITIIAKKRDSISMIGFGGRGFVGVGRISTLTKVQ